MIYSIEVSLFQGVSCDLQYRGVLISGCHVIYSIEVSLFQGVM